MENISEILVKYVYTENHQCQVVLELIHSIIAAANKIQTEILQKLIDSRPNRIFQLIQNKGDPTI